MSRPLRIEYPGAYYHVMNRGLSRAAIFSIDDDYGMFLAAVEEASRYFDIRIIAFCLMTNHYHLLIHTPRGNLSRAMRHLGGVYTQRYNRLHKKDGPLFKGRYKAILVQEDEYLTHLIRYIHLNPLEANLTDHLSRYPHSSHSNYLKGKDNPSWLNVRQGLAFFGSQLKAAQKKYQLFMKDGLDPLTTSFYKKKNQPSIFGDSDFIEEIRAKYLVFDAKITTESKEGRQLKGQAMAAQIIRQARSSFKVTPEGIDRSRRGEPNPARFAVIYLIQELSGLTQPEIAKLFKIPSYRSIGTACYRFKKMIHKNASLRKKYDTIRQRCIQGRI